ncbi:MAG: hypothetical protein IKO27_04990 [Ruminococcus sp.]|nr:hypothetical protein [Ruminococcus sp.]
MVLTVKLYPDIRKKSTEMQKRGEERLKNYAKAQTFRKVLNFSETKSATNSADAGPRSFVKSDEKTVMQKKFEKSLDNREQV